MFERVHHQRIQQFLSCFNSDFLIETNCYFGGGTAIVLSLNEYRESVDVDFICSSPEGYRELRNTINNVSLGAILTRPVELVREVRADRYGIRTFVNIDDTPIKFEIVREDRIEVEGDVDPVFGVPTLARYDMYAEKLLANADRYYDKSTACRDIIDLAMLIDHWGDIPPPAWAKVRKAYGESVNTAYMKALDQVCNPDHLSACLSKMHMEAALVERIPAILRGSAPYPVPDLSPDIPTL